MVNRGFSIGLLCAPLALVFGCPLLNPDECATDADCAAGELCVAGGCVECEVDADCPAGELCTADYTCVECETDADCAAGEVCTNNACVAGPECQVDADCAAGEVCTDGTCVAGGGGGDPAAGETFYTANGCAACHAADGSGGVGPDIRDETAAGIFARLSGAASHPVTVAGVTMENAEDLAAWLNSL